MLHVVSSAVMQDSSKLMFAYSSGWWLSVSRCSVVGVPVVGVGEVVVVVVEVGVSGGGDEAFDVVPVAVGGECVEGDDVGGVGSSNVEEVGVFVVVDGV